MKKLAYVEKLLFFRSSFFGKGKNSLWGKVDGHNEAMGGINVRYKYVLTAGGLRRKKAKRFFLYLLALQL